LVDAAIKRSQRRLAVDSAAAHAISVRFADDFEFARLKNIQFISFQITRLKGIAAKCETLNMWTDQVMIRLDQVMIRLRLVVAGEFSQA